VPKPCKYHRCAGVFVVAVTVKVGPESTTGVDDGDTEGVGVGVGVGDADAETVVVAADAWCANAQR
jgi:hypothetical protein